MYKKITHNIVEEHFAHPLSAQLKKEIDKTKLVPNTRGYGATAMSNIQMDSHKQFNKLFWGIRHYLVSALGANDDSTTLIKTNLLKDVASFGPFFAAYYSTQVGNDVVTHLTSFANSFVDAVQLARSGRDYSAQLTAARTHLDALAKVLSLTNPTTWPEAVVKSYFAEYVTKVTEQIVARVKKDWKTDAVAESQSHMIISTGPIDFGVLKDSPDFACVVAAGIEAQHPTMA